MNKNVNEHAVNFYTRYTFAIDTEMGNSFLRLQMIRDRIDH